MANITVAEFTEKAQDRFWANIKKGAPDECWPYTGFINAGGYGRFYVGKVGILSHRAVWAIFAGEFPSAHVCHKCDNRRCCNPGHLFIGTQADNMRDMKEKGRSQKGEAKPQAKLTEQAVRAIRQQAQLQFIQQKILAERYGVGATTIHSIVHRRKWKHVV
jgi:hypothetical protein